MSEKKNLRWLCTRCAKKEKATTEAVAPILKACGVCGVENWVLPEASTNTTDGLVYDEITPVETAPEAESPEEDEAVEEAVDEALEAVIEEAAEIEKEPEETPPEAKPEPSTNVLSGDIDIGPLEDKIAARDAAIAELEAKLEALKK